MRDLSDCYLYGILDLGYVEKARAADVVREMIRGGVDIIQLRGKNKSVDDLADLASTLHTITGPADIPLIVNDHAEIARRIEVEGGHVGQDDESITSVRGQVGRAVWVGKSTHSLDQAVAAHREGADYIGFGPIYATPTKPNYPPIGLSRIGEVHQQVTVPIFCIGGIKLENLAQIVAAGAKRVVIVSGLLQATDICEYAAACKKLISRQS